MEPEQKIEPPTATTPPTTETAPVVKTKPKPLTDDFYWFAVAKDMIDKGPERISESAKKFSALILWLWGIYTPLIGIGGSALSIYLKVQFDLASIFLLILPSFFLLIGYWSSTMAKTASVVEFEQNNIESIKSAYNETIAKRGKFYLLAQIFTGAACLLIPIALLIFHTSQKDKMHFIATLDKSNKKIILIGEFPKKDKIKISHLSKPSEEVKLIESRLYKEFYLTDEDLKITPMEVYVEYEDGEMKYRLVKQF